MSQVYVSNGSGGGGGSIITINGDSGSITGSTVTIYADNAANNSGASVKFVNSGTISTLNLSDTDHNTFLGEGSGNLTTTATENACLGLETLMSVTSSSENVAMGNGAMSSLTSGDGSNVAIGFTTLGFLTTGSDNIVIGAASGSAYTGSESNNILMDNAGVAGENRVTRIGSTDPATGQTECFIAGITGNTVSNAEFVTINSSTGQLGVTSSSSTATGFFAYANTNIPNAIGGSVFYTPIFNSTARNDGTMYDTSTGVVTVPKTGLYSFQTIINMTNVITSTEIAIGYTGSVNSQTLTLLGAGSIGAFQNVVLNAAWSAQMTAGDTVHMTVFSNESAQTITLNGAIIEPNIFNGQSSFSGFFVGT